MSGPIVGTDFGYQPAGLRGIGEDDALADGRGKHRRIVIGKRLSSLAGDDSAGAATVEHETGGEVWPVDARFPRSVSISAEAQPSKGDGCTGISTRSAASSAERIRAATRGGPSMTT